MPNHHLFLIDFSENTVKTHIKHAMAKLNARTRSQAIAIWLTEKWGRQEIWTERRMTFDGIRSAFSITVSLSEGLLALGGKENPWGFMIFRMSDVPGHSPEV